MELRIMPPSRRCSMLRSSADGMPRIEFNNQHNGDRGVRLRKGQKRKSLRFADNEIISLRRANSLPMPRHRANGARFRVNDLDQSVNSRREKRGGQPSRNNKTHFPALSFRIALLRVRYPDLGPILSWGTVDEVMTGRLQSCAVEHRKMLRHALGRTGAFRRALF
jgi:hypothetical protein